jgi:DNA-binding XRE family transcriptional regulator
MPARSRKSNAPASPSRSPCPQGATAVLKHFQAQVPYGLARYGRSWTMTRSSAAPISTSRVAARLRLTRQALKLSQVGLCRITRISPQAWNNAETGDNLIGLANAMKLCRATGVTLDWIYRGVGSNLPRLIATEIARRKRAARQRRP